MRSRPETPEPGRATDDGAIPIRASSAHEVRVAARIARAGSARGYATATVMTSFDSPIELLSAVHESVALDLIGAVQRDGVLCVIVTMTVPGRAAVAAQAMTTVVPADSSADFALGAADGLEMGTVAQGTIRNRLLR